MSEASRPTREEGGQAPVASDLNDGARSQFSAIVFFDGECGLCQRSIRFVAAHDSAGVFRFAPLTGSTAAARLSGLPTAPAAAQTVVLLEGTRLSTRSTAALRIAARLDMPWRLLSWLRVVPRPVRDAVYDLVSRHRRRWFGTAASCGVPAAALRERMLD